MDVRAGKIYEGDPRDLAKELNASLDSIISVAEDEMTKKQKENMRVSLHDNKSKLGKKLQEKRKELGYSQMSKNQRRNLKKRLWRRK